MKLERLELENFRGFTSFTLDFHPELTVIAGINGSGKTSILDVTNFLLWLSTKGMTTGGFDKLDCRIGQDTARISLRGRTQFSDTKKWHAEMQFVRSGWRSAHEPQIAFTEAQRSAGPLPIRPYYPVNRHAEDATPGSTNPQVWRADVAWELFRINRSFNDFFLWFREREDLENEERRDNPSYVDHLLDTVRKALVSILPGYEKPRVRRPRFGGNGTDGPKVDNPVLTVVKEGRELAFNQLSEGERTTAVLACDIARRLAVANPNGDPLLGDGVVLIDEIDLHLHPKWQAQVIDALRRTFPHIQWVVTTHSPIVLSRVPSESVRLVKDFQLVENLPITAGRDPNALLTDIFESPLRPKDVEAQIHQVAALIDNEDLEGAKAALNALQQRLGHDDREVARLSAAISFLEA
jgi:recombinational DNA repair ATPase RecF